MEAYCKVSLFIRLEVLRQISKILVRTANLDQSSFPQNEHMNIAKYLTQRKNWKYVGMFLNEMCTSREKNLT
jgi:hypothetical protein